MSLGIMMKRNHKKINPSIVSSNVESEAKAAMAANYVNGEMVEATSEYEEENGRRPFYRLPRRLNSGLFKTISRKLPCFNYRRASGSSREGVVSFTELSQSQTDVSCSPTINVKERSHSSNRQGKLKNRATCSIMPSPIRLPPKNVEKSNVESEPVKKQAVSLVSGGEEAEESFTCIGECPTTTPDIATRVTVEDLGYSSASSSTTRLSHISVNHPSNAYLEIYSNTAPQTRSLTMELYRLAKYGWYWGPISRSEAEERLHGQSDGAFLVRDSSDDRYLLSLSFRSFDKTLHTRIEHCNGMFSFYVQPETESHASVVELIEHSMSYSQSGVFCYSKARTPGAPSYPVRLTRPVSRFTQVRSLQYLCRFVIRQYTRVDLIQDLPLPNRIKGYIKEAHY